MSDVRSTSMPRDVAPDVLASSHGQRSTSEPQDAVLAPRATSTTNSSRGGRSLPIINLMSAFGGGAHPDEPIPSVEGGDDFAHLSPFGSPSTILSPFSDPGTGLNRARTPTNLVPMGLGILRPSSVLSMSSSGSSSSSNFIDEQIELFSVAGDVQTSPETEGSAQAPKSLRSTGPGHRPLPPSAALTYSESAMRGGRNKTVHWTREMDGHLWACLIRYIGDPTTAPFQMRRGQPPPFGVRTIVAREAQKSWRGHGSSAAALPFRGQTSIDAVLEDKEQLPAAMRWPSKKATRRRLCELAREPDVDFHPTLQRHIMSRSPTPLGPGAPSRRGVLSRQRLRDEEPASRVSRRTDGAAFDTRDVQVALATSTSQTMRRNGPLEQLATQNDQYFANLSAWFNNSSAPLASHGFNHVGATTFGSSAFPPQQHGSVSGECDPSTSFSSTDASGPTSPAPAVQLASPITLDNYSQTWTPGTLQQQLREVQPPPAVNPYASVPRLRSPAPIHGRPPHAHSHSSNKRSAPFPAQDAFAHGPPEDHPDAPGLHPIEATPGPTGTMRRVRRSRGLTLNDVFQARAAPGVHSAGPSFASQSFTLPAPPPPPSRPSLGSLFTGLPGLQSAFDGSASLPTRQGLGAAFGSDGAGSDGSGGAVARHSASGIFDGIASRPSRVRPQRAAVTIFAAPDAASSIDARLQGDVARNGGDEPMGGCS